MRDRLHNVQPKAGSDRKGGRKAGEGGKEGREVNGGVLMMMNEGDG